MRLLLDTHVLVWAGTDPSRLPPPVAAAVAEPRNTLLVSAASIWEIAIKAALRRKEFRVDPEGLIAASDAAGLQHVPFVTEHAVHVARLPAHHADPFDRALIAQALLEPLVLLTHDETLARYGTAVRFV